MSEKEMGQIQELCVALGVGFCYVFIPHSEEFIKLAEVFHISLVPRYEVRVEGRPFFYYEAAKTYLEIKFGKYGKEQV